MTNRHAPHSHIAPDPKKHKPCRCGKQIGLRPQFPAHQCSEAKCVNGIHDYAGEYCPPHVRYFTDFGEEMCEDCVKRTYGADVLVHRSGE